MKSLICSIKFAEGEVRGWLQTGHVCKLNLNQPYHTRTAAAMWSRAATPVDAVRRRIGVLFLRARSQPLAADRPLSPLQLLPLEIVLLILEMLPICGELLQAATLSTKVFGLPLGDLAFARRHILLQNALRDVTGWHALPFSYKAALIELMLVRRAPWGTDWTLSHSQADSKLIDVYTSVPGVNLRMNDDGLFRWACRWGHIGLAQKLVGEHGANPAAKGNDAIATAATGGYTQLCSWLLEQEEVDPSSDHDYALRVACALGHMPVVMMLLADPRTNPASDSNNAIRAAAALGAADVVEALLSDPRVNPADMNSNALWSAAERGHARVVRILLDDERCDPAAVSNQALRMAAQNGHADIVAMLLNDPRVDPNAMDFAALRAAHHRMHSSPEHMAVVRLLLADLRIPQDIKKEHAIPFWFF
ncbi:hypothetical protein HDU82_006681 [Entophlyctis luteolus]|nr:hypothetical protein HDU82_006681 [Entophlyctis luteolus]